MFALLVVAYGWLFVYFDKLNNPNEMVRVYMARAIVEHGTYAIGERVAVPGGGLRDTGPVYDEWGYVNDKALVCDDPRASPPACAGKLYAAKAPGPSFLAVPVLAALRFLGAPVGLRWLDVLVLRWTLCILPTAVFWVVLRRFLLAAGALPQVALGCVVAGGLGSLSFTYGQMFAGHQLAALCLGSAYLAAFWRSRPALLGFFSGLAVCCEYPSAPAAAILCGAWVLSRRRAPSAIAVAALSALLPVAALLHFHWAAFGAPWATPYSHLENPFFVRDIAPGVLGISLPTWERIWGSLFSPFLGLFFWAPWTAIAVGLLPFLWRRGGARERVAVLVVGYYLVFQITHALWRSGWTVGPRYITPLVPFAAVCVGLTLARLPNALPLLAGAAAPAIAATGLASLVCQGFPLEVYNPLVDVVWPLLAHGYVPRNLLQLAGVPGLWSALPSFAALAVGVSLLFRMTSGRSLAIACAVAACLVFAQWTATSGQTPTDPAGVGAVRFFASIWEPDPPPGAHPF
ncbi:MAG: hypothetical protein ACJ79O_14515 [Myxococcales bacterium]